MPTAAGLRSPNMLGVLSVASEIYPLIKTGGLADVTGALPAALADAGVRVTTLVPGYPAVLAALAAPAAYPLGEIFGGAARLLAGEAAGLELLALDAPHLYARDGGPYQGPDRRDWPDNAFRFAALGQAAAVIAAGAAGPFRPDLVHAHDWQAGLAPAYLHYRQIPVPSVFTVHNLAFQGQFPPDLLGALGLPPESFTIDGVEYYGSIGFLKAGLHFATRLTTVSPGYAAEIETPAGGMGLDGLLRTRAQDLRGIVNGIDTREWDPGSDPRIPCRYDAGSLARRAANKAAIQARLGLPVDMAAPLFGAITRLTAQKGSDLLLAALPTLRAAGAQLALLGSGDAALEAAFRGEPGCVIGYDETLAHMIQAGADAILVPSRFEPCGLTQLCALRYGAVPVVAAVGGLRDTVADGLTGLLFAPASADALTAAIWRAVALFRDSPAWRAMQRAGMETDVSWRRPAAAYAALYRQAAT